MSGSCSKTQIIPTNKVAGFKVQLCSNTIKVFREQLTYVINDFHKFYALVTGEIVPAELELSRSQIAFKFRDDSLDRTSTEKLVLYNRGTIAVQYKLRLEGGQAFKVSATEGKINPLDQAEVILTYLPASIKDEDSLEVEVVDGVTKHIKLLGNVNESKCELIGGTLMLNTLAVGQRKRLNIVLKNFHQKYAAIYEIDQATIPECMTITPKNGKILPEDEVKFDVDIHAEKKYDFKNHEIIINVRGSLPFKCFLTLSTILPVIEIEQPGFDFGEVTFGSKAVLPLTLCNKSPIPAELILPLHSRDPTIQENFEGVNLVYIPVDANDQFGIEPADPNEEIHTPGEQREKGEAD